MAPRRKMISTSAVRSEKLAAIPAMAERLYWRIHMASDNYGTMGGKPWDVKHQCLPGIDVALDDVVRDLDILVAIELLQRWDHDGEPWIHVLGHDKYQSADFLRKRGKRVSPVPPAFVSALAAAMGSKGQNGSISREVCHSLPIAALTTSTKEIGDASELARTAIAWHRQDQIEQQQDRWRIPSGFEDAVAPALREVPLSSPSRGTTPVGAGEAAERDPDSSGHVDAEAVS